MRMSLDLIDTAYNGSYFTISLANNQSKKVQLQKKQQPYFESKVKSPHYRMLIMMSTINVNQQNSQAHILNRLYSGQISLIWKEIRFFCYD